MPAYETLKIILQKAYQKKLAKAKVNGRNKKISRGNIREMQKECNCIIKEIYLVDRIFLHKVYCIHDLPNGTM